jgi:thiamine-monophosphate kinase
MTGVVPLGPGAEFDIIRRMVDRWGTRASGIGDDAAVLRLTRGDAVVASVDSFVEAHHFKREWLTPREIGYKAVAAALSDLAAMAARPVGILVALTLPDSWRQHVDELADGIGDAADVAETSIVGGNLSGGGTLSITTTVLGAAFAPLTRAGARDGDFVYVTGRLGGPAAAIQRFSSGHAAAGFRHRFAHPMPRLAEARWLVERGAASAIDISDGLIADLRHLSAASGVSIDVEAQRVPCMKDVETSLALESGEEYELVITSPREIDSVEFERRFDIPLTRIGRVSATPDRDVTIDGARVARPSGYDHFSS